MRHMPGQVVWKPILERRHTNAQIVIRHLFTQAGSLKKYMMVHTGEKPYKWVECDETHARTGSLKTHTGEKAYKCTDCDKAFIYPDKSENIHDGPYWLGALQGLWINNNKWWSILERSLNVVRHLLMNAKGLKQHIVRHTREKPNKCTVWKSI